MSTEQSMESLNPRKFNNLMTEVDGCLVVPVPNLPDRITIRHLTRSILNRLRQSTNMRVIFNLSAVSVMDSHIFKLLSDSTKAIKLMGSEVVITGIQPGVASSLVDLDIPLDHLITSVTTKDAKNVLRQLSEES